MTREEAGMTSFLVILGIFFPKKISGDPEIRMGPRAPQSVRTDEAPRTTEGRNGRYYKKLGEYFYSVSIAKIRKEEQERKKNHLSKNLPRKKK